MFPLEEEPLFSAPMMRAAQAPCQMGDLGISTKKYTVSKTSPEYAGPALGPVVPGLKELERTAASTAERDWEGLPSTMLPIH